MRACSVESAARQLSLNRPSSVRVSHSSAAVRAASVAAFCRSMRLLRRTLTRRFTTFLRLSARACRRARRAAAAESTAAVSRSVALGACVVIVSVTVVSVTVVSAAVVSASCAYSGGAPVKRRKAMRHVLQRRRDITKAKSVRKAAT